MLLAILIHIVDYNTSILEEKISVCYTTKKKITHIILKLLHKILSIKHLKKSSFEVFHAANMASKDE